MISQGIGRENYSNLELMGKSQMSRGKTHQDVNYPFCLLCPVIRSGWGSYFLGMGKVWRSNSNSGSRPVLESVFLTCGEVKAWEGMPKPLCTHAFHLLTHSLSCGGSLTQQEEEGALSLTFGCRFCISACPEIGLGSC